MRMHACMYVRMQVCMHSCMNICMYAWLHVYIYIYACIHRHTCVYIYIYIYVFMHECMHVCMCSCSQVRNFLMSISDMSEDLQWVDHLRRKFGHARVEDLLEGTGLESYAVRCGFGMQVVREAVPEELLPRLDSLDTVMDDISAKSQRSGRAVAVQGSRRQRWYRSVHATVDNCMCKYNFGATTRHEVYKVENIPVLKEILEWVHSLGDIRLKQQFNEILGNVYMRDLDECVSWHSDANTLYSESTDVL